MVGLQPGKQNQEIIAVNRIHRIIPVSVGSRAATAVHFQLPVSFFMVRSVVEQGQ